MKTQVKNSFSPWKILVVVFLILTGLSSLASSEEKYVFDRMWPTLRQPWYFLFPYDVAVDNERNVYVADSWNYRIKKFNMDGDLITDWEVGLPICITLSPDGDVWVSDHNQGDVKVFTQDGDLITNVGTMGSGEGQFLAPAGIAFDDQGYVYVADTIRCNIQKFSNAGEFISSWGEEGDGPGMLKYPYGIAIDEAGTVFISEGTMPPFMEFFSEDAVSRIQKFDTAGNFIAVVSTQGSTAGQVNNPQKIALDKLGRLYIADTGNARIQVFNPDGTVSAVWNGFNAPVGLAVSYEGRCYVADTYSHRIHKYSTSGEPLSLWGSDGQAPGYFFGPMGVAVDSADNVFVADPGNSRIQKFDKNGQFLDQWEPCITDLDFDVQGNIYASGCDNKVYKFNAQGQIIDAWGNFGSGNGEFNDLTGIAVGNGYVYVADANNYRIQRFDLAGDFVSAWGTEGSGDGQFRWIHDIDIGPDGDVFVSECTYIPNENVNDRVQKFTPDGTFVLKWGQSVTEESSVQSPFGIAVDNQNQVYVLSDHRVKIFTGEGDYIGCFGGFGNGPGQMCGPYGIAVNSTGDIYVSDQQGTNRVQMFKKADALSHTKAVIVAGGGPYQGNTLWNVTQMNANFAYRALTFQGYAKDDIYYLSSDMDLDLDSNGKADEVDAEASVSNLQQAITSWASDADNLVLYLIGDGDSGTFRMNNTQFLSVNDLNAWLNTLEETITGKIVIVYDAFSSGSFMPYLISSANADRIVITSTAPGEKAHFVSQGSVSFSSFFWTHVFNGNTVYEAFNKAKTSLVEALGTQHPLLDDTGNGIGSEENDGILAQATFLGNGTGMTGEAPMIGEVSPSQTIMDGGSSLLYAKNVTDTNGIARVWAVIQPPYYTLDLPIIDLMPAGSDDYEASWNGFDQHGTYKIAIYARDGMGNVSSPSKTTVSVNNPAAMQPNATLKIFIETGEKDVYAVDDVLTLKANYRTSAGEDLDVSETVNWTITDPDIGILSPGEQVMNLTLKANGKVRVIASVNAKKAQMDFIAGQTTAIKHHGNLIIVAGGKPDDPKDTLKDAVQYLADQMYKVFKARKFTDQDIYYINHISTQDLDGDGFIDGIVDQTDKTVGALKNAISWAQSQPNEGPLYLHLIDHGSKNGSFLINTDQILTAADLNAALQLFETATGRKSIVILDACYSGSFMETLKDTDRIVFTSSAADEYSYFSSSGEICFGQFLSNYLLIGQNWEQSFDNAVSDMDTAGEPYTSMTPQKFMGAEVPVAPVYGDFAIAGLFPGIKTWTTGTEVSKDTAQSLSVELDVMDTAGVSVWALIMPPFYQPPTTDEAYATPALGLEKIDLKSEQGSKTFFSEYAFTSTGTYNVTFYVKDSNGIVISSPPETFVVTGGAAPGNTIKIGSNWNLLSLPVVPEDTSVEAVLSQVKDNITSVWKWEDDKWAVFLPSFSLGDYLDYVNTKGFGFLTDLTCGQGFWVNSGKIQTLTVSGTPPAATSCSLTEDWNLVGLKSDQAKSITDLIGENADNIVSVWKWQDGKWAVYLPSEDDGGASYAGSKGFTVLSNIEPGEGFWVNCSAEITLE